MSEAENLLNTLDDVSITTADPATEEHIVIDSNRNIYVPEALRRIAVQYDHNIETVAFDCPRYWDGIDMSGMKVYINYRRADGKIGQYWAEKVIAGEQYYEAGDQIGPTEWEDPDNNAEPFDLSQYEKVEGYTLEQVGYTPRGLSVFNVSTPEDNQAAKVVKKGSPDLMYFDWVISRNVTEVKGPLSFLVCVNTTDDEGNDLHHWNSELNSDMIVSEGLEPDDVINELYPDIVTQLLIRMDGVEADNAATRDYIDESVQTEVSSVVQSMIEDGNIGGVDLSGYATTNDLNEAYADLNDKIYGHDADIETLKSSVTDIASGVDNNASNIATNTDNIATHTQSIADINTALGLIADYPVEVGTTEVDGVTWTYEKRNSGKVELYSIVSNVSNAVNSWLKINISLPFTVLNVIPSFSILAGGWALSAEPYILFELEKVNDAHNALELYYKSAESGERIHMFSIHITGRWK